MRREEKFPPDKKISAIKCECGFDIPVIPNAEKVGNAIDAHAEEHRRRNPNETKGKKEAEQIRNDLIRKLFERISQVCI